MGARRGGLGGLQGGGRVAQIEQLARHPKLKGLRPMLQDLPDDDWIADPATDPAAEAMARHGLVFDALVLRANCRAC